MKTLKDFILESRINEVSSQLLKRAEQKALQHGSKYRALKFAAASKTAKDWTADEAYSFYKSKFAVIDTVENNPMVDANIKSTSIYNYDRLDELFITYPIKGNSLISYVIIVINIETNKISSIEIHEPDGELVVDFAFNDKKITGYRVDMRLDNDDERVVINDIYKTITKFGVNINKNELIS